MALMTEERRGWLMVFATLTASITYSAALNPPGGMWQADDTTNEYVAGFPVLLDKSLSRYMAFYFLNAASFLSSVCIIALLALNRRMLPLFKGVTVLNILVTLNMAAMVGAFIAGSSSASALLIVDVVVVGLALILFSALILVCKIMLELEHACDGSMDESS